MARCKTPFLSDHVEGSTPPGVFVGRIGYPKVYIGPMIPPYLGDTTILDTPELWVGKGIDNIIDYRFSLIRGKVKASIFDAREGTRILDSLQELALSGKPVDSEARLTRIPHMTLTLSGESQPFGPSAPLRSFRTSEANIDHKIERVFYDKDLKAADAVMGLYNEGTSVTRIQRAFSLGMFGEGKRRRLVPTRWGITAVDSILSSSLVDQVKQYPPINEYRVYYFENLDNRFLAILMPEAWSFEWIEAWFPGTTWNPASTGTPALMGDFEPYGGRKTYPDVGGCYYSCKLAVAEALERERRQASALVLREIHPGYIVPVGVWNVRESIRETLRRKPELFPDLRSALNYAATKLTIPLEKWTQHSQLLNRALFQKKITEFV
jgi:hypothetical protein